MKSIRRQFQNPQAKGRIRTPYILGAVFFTALGLVLSHTYRPYIFTNQINDFHLADTIGSWVCVPAASLFFYGRNDKNKFSYYILLTVAGYILWEFLGLAGIHGTFDYWDILAVILSGILTYLAYYFIQNYKQKKLNSV